jgi:histidine triad (HIT) family protein
VTEQPCPFCEIVAGRAAATVICEWDDALAIVPLDPVVDGHLLVIPKTHTADFSTAHYVAAMTMHRASELAAESDQPMNLITSRGREATQSVFHLHLHLVPRAENDGLALPWYSGKKGTGVQINVRPKPADDEAFSRGFAAGRRAQ